MTELQRGWMKWGETRALLQKRDSLFVFGSIVWCHGWWQRNTLCFVKLLRGKTLMKSRKKKQSHSIQHRSIIQGSNKAAAKVPKQVMCSRTGLSSGRMNKSVSSWTVGSEANLQLASKCNWYIIFIFQTYNYSSSSAPSEKCHTRSRLCCCRWLRTALHWTFLQFTYRTAQANLSLGLLCLPAQWFCWLSESFCLLNRWRNQVLHGSYYWAEFETSTTRWLQLILLTFSQTKRQLHSVGCVHTRMNWWDVYTLRPLACLWGAISTILKVSRSKCVLSDVRKDKASERCSDVLGWNMMSLTLFVLPLLFPGCSGRTIITVHPSLLLLPGCWRVGSLSLSALCR